MKTTASQYDLRGSDFRYLLSGENIIFEVEVLALKHEVFYCGLRS